MSYKPRFPQHGKPVKIISQKRFRKFFPDPFGADVFYKRPVFPYGIICIAFNFKIKLYAEPYGPEHPQGVLSESFAWIAHTSYYFSFNVSHSSENIHISFFRGICHCIRRKIPPKQVLMQIPCKTYAGRAAAVLIPAFNSICRYFIVPPANYSRYSSVFNARIHSMAEYFLYFFRNGRRCYIPVVWTPSHYRIPYAPSYNISLISMLFYFVNYINNVVWQNRFFHLYSPYNKLC